MRWTGVISAGVVYDTPASTMDIYPTLLELAGVPAPRDQPLDGVSLRPVLRNPRARLSRDTLYWHLPHYHHSTPASAIRRGDWKLIEFFEHGALELYNLRDDMGEQRNLARQRPGKVRELRSVLSAWRKQVGARMPKPNPDYDPTRASELARPPAGINGI